MAQFDLKKLFRVPPPEQRVAAMGLRPDLARAAVDVAFDQRFDPEIQQLETCLLETESVVFMVEGRHRRQLGILVLTTGRVLFRPHGARAGQAWIVPLAQICSVDFQVRSMTGRVLIGRVDTPFEVDKILGQLAAQFVEAVRRQLADPGRLDDRR